MRLPRTLRRKLMFLSVYATFCMGLIAGATRLYWYFVAGVPITQEANAWDSYYPLIRISGLVRDPPQRGDKAFDVLLLGGSVLHSDWGNIESLLRQRLNRECPRPVRIFNLARQALTSQDSLLQYEHLDNARFDLVIVYDGINDVRMNCCPPELYQADYTHFIWYRDFAKARQRKTAALAETASDQLKRAFNSQRLGTPEADLVEYAADPKTPESVYQNLKRIAQIAHERGDRLLLLSYAWHIPADYTLDKFSEFELDYANEAPNRCAVELWGKAEYVAQALREQNARIRELASESPECRFVDMFELLPRTGTNFIDPCHLTPAGCETYVEIIWQEVESAWQASNSR